MWCGESVAVVVPAHNEARLLGRVLDTMPGWVDHVVVVDDGSTDGTAAVARRYGPRVSLREHPRNLGVGAAILSGYREAQRRGAGAIAVMAGDAQMDPRELHRLVDPVVRGEVDYCKGDRTAHPDFMSRMPTLRRLGNAGLTWLTRRASGYGDLRDAQCGFTVISSRALEAIPVASLYPRYGYPNDLLVMLGGAGAGMEERVVTPVYGDERSGLNPWLALITHSFVLLRALWRRGRSSSVRRRSCASVS